ncbi:MAG: putative amidohydrolase YtcJ [Gammaproteobacteria bacterium]|jgi:predicted amidohydrolase YtcJ
MNEVTNLPFKIFLICIGFFYTANGFSQQIDPRLVNYPETIIINGKITSMDDVEVNESVGSTYQALAIRDGRIMSMGTSESIGRLAGPETAVYDVKGRTVIPGIVDTHAHIWQYAQSHWGPGVDNEFRITAVDGETWQDVIKKTLALISDLKNKLEPNEWVLINWPGSVDGLNKNVAIRTHRIMTRQMLDEANDIQRIAILGNRGVMNTLAMETYGKLFAGEYPPEIDPTNGIVISATVYRHLFAEELYDLKASIAMIGQEIREWTAYGTTTFSSSIESPKQLTAVLALDAEKKLATRVAYGLGNTFYLTMKGHPYLGYDFGGYGTDKLWFNAWSNTSNDGAYPLFASTIEAPPQIKERELLRSRMPATKEFAAMGLRFGNTHIAGDRTLDVTMDMIEAGSKEAGLSAEEIRSKRHGSDHCNLNPRPDQMPRLARLGIIMSCTPMYIARTNAAEIAEEYGEEYLEWLVPMRSIIEGGVRAVYESDSHQIAGTGNFYYFGQMVNRINGEGKVIAPNQRINRTWALKTATTWAPYYLHKEDVIGTLEEGKYADIIVLNKDYFNEQTVPDLMIKTVRPLMTFVGGEVLFLDPGLAEELDTQPVGIQPEQVIKQIAEWEAEAAR